MSRLKVLIVDDDRDVAETLAELLERSGFEARTAFDGKSAISAMGRQRFDVAVVDIGLPDVDGVEVAIEIRRIRPELRAFLMTGYASHEISERAQRAGALEIFVKPLNLDLLVEKLRPERE